MTKRLSRWWSVLLAAFLALVAPLTHAITRWLHPTESSAPTSAGADEAAAATALAFTVLQPPVGPPATPFSGPLEVFINGLLVEDSKWGLVQSSAASTFSYLSGWGYTPEQYLRVTFAVPDATSTLVAGIAVTPQGEVHVVDATAGLPGGVVYVGGFPVANAGQLCVVLA